MKNIILIIILSVFVGSAFSQSIGNNQTKAEKQAITLTQKMNQKLNLSDEQMKQVIVINTEAFTKVIDKRKEFISKGQLKNNKEEMQKTFKLAFKERNEKLKNILSSEQFDTFKNSEKPERNKAKKK